MSKRDWAKIVDEMCQCGAKKSEHVGFNHHLGCERTNYIRFTWKHFLDKNGKKVE